MKYRPVAYQSLDMNDDKSKTHLRLKGIGFGFGKRSDFTYMP